MMREPGRFWEIHPLRPRGSLSRPLVPGFGWARIHYVPKVIFICICCDKKYCSVSTATPPIAQWSHLCIWMHQMASLWWFMATSLDCSAQRIKHTFVHNFPFSVQHELQFSFVSVWLFDWPTIQLSRGWVAKPGTGSHCCDDCGWVWPWWSWEWVSTSAIWLWRLLHPWDHCSCPRPDYQWFR